MECFFFFFFFPRHYLFFFFSLPFSLSLFSFLFSLSVYFLTFLISNPSVTLFFLQGIYSSGVRTVGLLFVWGFSFCVDLVYRCMSFCEYFHLFILNCDSILISYIISAFHFVFPFLFFSLSFVYFYEFREVLLVLWLLECLFTAWKPRAHFLADLAFFPLHVCGLTGGALFCRYIQTVD